MMFSHRNLLIAGRYALLLLAFCAMLVKAYSALQNLDPLPRIAPPKPAERPVFVDPKHLSVVMAVHPNCVCTTASLAELRKIFAHSPDDIVVTLLEFTPVEEPENWTTAAAAELSALSKMQARILTDTNGDIARHLGISKSGQVKIFSPNGNILYDGGLTGEFGMTGANSTEELITDIINGSTFNPVRTPSFGCKLFEQPGCENGALEIAHN